ncbi:hypothetical protein F5Y18DRAFT_389762 [Xylariaceae sp. FL1019]|nr:hypothetical protein F5Y18DRAFT_389762 [Xylariaceae sp. FL1019]
MKFPYPMSPSSFTHPPSNMPLQARSSMHSLRNEVRGMPRENSDSDVPALIYALSVLFTVIPTLAVLFRFQVRFRSHVHLGNDDWTILFALLSCIATAVLLIVGAAAGGMGRPLKRDTGGNPIYDQEYVVFEEVTYAICLTQVLAIGATKVSVLLLYRRIFGIEGRRFNKISIALLLSATAWTLIFFITNTIQFEPINAGWTQLPLEVHHRFPKGNTDMFLAQSYVDAGLDVLIIILPIPLVLKLQTTPQKKFLICTLFLLGAITTAASIARTVIQYGVAREFRTGNVDTPYFLAPISYWPLIEAGIGILAACMPMLRPIYQIYSFKNMISLSSRAMSSIFGGSRSKLSNTNSSQDSNRYLEIDRASRRADPKGNTKWFKPYDLSILQPTVDHESQVEAIPNPSATLSATSDGIQLERGYEVSFQRREYGHV